MIPGSNKVKGEASAGLFFPIVGRREIQLPFAAGKLFGAKSSKSVDPSRGTSPGARFSRLPSDPAWRWSEPSTDTVLS